MQLESMEGWYQLKQFGIFFLGVVVGVFVTIILFFYGCFKSFSISSRSPTTRNSDSISTSTIPEDVENQMPPPSYSSLRFDKKPCKPCKCCHVVKNMFKK
ncbi:unnamed protein product [Caenorhabditis brenneri]